MKLEDSVVRLELAKEMKELGVRQDSLWCWIRSPCRDSGYECRLSWNSNPYLENYSAYSVAELGEILPEGYFSRKQGNSWVCANSDNTFAITNVYDCDRTYSEADARAKMIIYLIKTGIIKAEEVGK